MIRLDRIRPDPSQPRRELDTDSQRELIASVKRLGLLQPITVRYLAEDDTYQIISGERRYQAAKQAGMAEIPCWEQKPAASEVLLRQIVENWQRAELKPYDLADALAQLRDANGYSQRQLARETGKPESEISRLLSLVNRVDPVVQQQAREDTTGQLTKRHMVAVATVAPAMQPAIVQEIKKRRLTAKQTEKLVRHKKAQASGAKTRGAPIARRIKYATRKATVTLEFRRKEVEAADVLTALDEVRAQVKRRATMGTLE